VDVRAEEVAAAKANDVLEPAEAAKTAAQAAQSAAEDAQSAAETAKAGAEAARDTTLAALPQVQSDIDALEGRMDTVELKVTTAEGNIVTIQGRVTAVETKNSQQDSAIAALQTADGQNIKITNLGQYGVTLSDYQIIPGVKVFEGIPGACNARNPNVDATDPPSSDIIVGQFVCMDKNNVELAKIIGVIGSNGQTYLNALVRNQDGTYKAVRLVTSD